jgi:hypothetical protein
MFHHYSSSFELAGFSTSRSFMISNDTQVSQLLAEAVHLARLKQKAGNSFAGGVNLHAYLSEVEGFAGGGRELICLAARSFSQRSYWACFDGSESS